MKTDNYCRCSKCIEQDEETASAPTPWSAKSEDAMVEGVARKNDSEQADRIRELEEQLNVRRFLFNQAAKELESEQVENHKLRCALSHIVDWCPEPSDYVKDEYIRLFRNAIATARELLSKCRVKEGKPFLRTFGKWEEDK